VADDIAAGQLEPAHRPLRLPAALDGGAGVEQPLTLLAGGVDRLVAVAEHDDAGSGEPAPHPPLATAPRPGVVDHPDPDAAQLDLQPVGERAGERPVVVAEHGVDGPPGAEGVEQVGGDDVAGVEHDVGGLDGVPHRGGELAEVGAEVGVGEDEHADGIHGPIVPQVGGPAVQRLVAKSFCKYALHMTETPDDADAAALTRPPTAPPTPETATVARLDAGSLKALAHPLRLRIVSSLRNEGPGTATTLGERLGESSGATSYHLRVLAAHGLVVEDAGRGRGRERWWRAGQDMTSWRAGEFRDDPDARAAEDWLTGTVGRHGMAWVDDWLQRRPTADPAWVEASDLSDYRVVATPDQVRAMMDDLHATISRHVDALAIPAGAPPPAGAAPVRLLLYAIPRVGVEGADGRDAAR